MQQGNKTNKTNEPNIRPVFCEHRRYFFFMNLKEYSIILFDTFSNVHELGRKLQFNSLSSWHETLDELIENNDIQENPCNICGKIYGIGYVEPVKKELKEKGICFSCNHWEGWRNRKEGTNKIIVGHFAYSDGGRKNNREASFMGHGGREFKIQMDNGSIIETNNLWCGGEIPKIFQDKIPDNAKFI